MKKYPFVHALSAALYIVFIVSAIYLMSILKIHDNTLLIPMAMLGLFVLSAAVMGFIFFYEPFELYFDGHKKEASSFFVKTVGYFACFAALFVLALIISNYW